MAPDTIFIIPYRNREKHRTFFRNHMKNILEDLDVGSYRTYFVHQRDDQPFNRGALKNIGFLAMKKEYPEEYKNITFVFNDVDVMPFEKNTISYKTTIGTIKHFYGFYFALGGIVSITGSDFEKLNGFPNFWAWGWEDNELQRRAETEKLIIDRSTFFPILSQDFIHLHHGTFREINPLEKHRYVQTTIEGITDVRLDTFIIEGDMIEVDKFSTSTIPSPDLTENVLLGGNFETKPIKNNWMKMNMTTSTTGTHRSI